MSASSVRWFPVALCSAALCACGPIVDVAGEPLALASTDPGLLDAAGTLAFTFTTGQTCVQVLASTPSQIATAQQADAPLQVVRVRDDAEVVQHTFGQVASNTDSAFVVLASTLEAPPQNLAEFEDTVFAMGCRDFSSEPGKKQDLPLAIFPAGLR
jgi:hypothetical protein